MSFRPAINRNSIWQVRRNTTGSLPIGRGVRLTGAVASITTLCKPPLQALCVGPHQSALEQSLDAPRRLPEYLLPVSSRLGEMCQAVLEMGN